MIKELIEQRNTLVAQAGVIAQNKDASKEQREQIKKMLVDIDELQEKIDIAKRMDILNEEVRSAGMPPRGQPGADFSNDSKENEALEVRAFENWMKGTIKPEERKYLRYEERAITGGPATATTGGGVFLPVGMDQLHVATKNIGELLGAIRIIYSDSTELLRVPLANDTTQSGTIQGENVAATEADPALSGFNSYVDQWNSGLITVGNPTLASAAFDVQGFISDAVNDRFLRYATNAITNGNSSNVASILAGASTVTAATGTTTTLNLKAILQLFGALDQTNRQGSAFLCNTATWVSMIGIVDTTGRSILNTDMNGAPFKMLLGQPIIISDAMPNIGVSTQPLAYGNFQKGYTARLGNLALRKSSDRFFEQNATAFAAWNVIGGFGTAVSGGPNPIIALTTSAT